MNSLPNGAFYAGRASLYPPKGVRGLPTTGTILFDRAGVKFNPKKDGASPTTITWDSSLGLNSFRLREDRSGAPFIVAGRR
jgi:hypothetical protein